MPPADERTKDAIFLLDGHSLAYRAFFALPTEIATSEGFPTNALYGFAAMLVKVLADFEPRVVIVTWDGPGPTFRHHIDTEYKAGRRETPDLFRMQLPFFHPLVEAFGYKNVVSPSGLEADDVIATLARRLDEDGHRVVIVTGDRDAFQLVSSNVSVLATSRGVTDTKLYGPAEVLERYGVGPELVPDFVALKGDTSDNIPGAAGIGEKTAAALLSEYGSLEAIVQAADQIKQPKRREALLAMRELGGDPPRARWERNLEMARARYDADYEIDLAAVAREPVDTTGLRELLRRFEFASLLSRIEELDEHLVAPPPPSDALVGIAERAPLDALPVGSGAPLAVAGVGGWWAACAADLPAPVAGSDDNGGPPADAAPVPVWVDERPPGDACAALLGPDHRGIVAHNWKGLFGRSATDETPGPAHDTELGMYLLEPQRRSYLLTNLVEDLGLPVEVRGVEDELPEAARGAAVAALMTARLATWQRERLDRLGLVPLLTDIELPLVRVLAEMERTGIAVDRPALEALAAEVHADANDLARRIGDIAGEDVNLGSPQQLAQLLYVDLGLKPGKRGKTGYSTDAEELQRLSGQHPVVDLLLQHRELSKLLSSQLDLLPQYIDPDDRIRTTFVQTAATTGRLSSNDPNLQAIPVRTEIGRRVRACFIAGPGTRLISCDYSQIELRVLAHASGEAVLRESLASGEDVHAATASEVFKIPRERLTKQERERAKAVNFGIMYGISGFGLARQLGTPREEAERYIRDYLNRFPAVQAFIEATHARAREDGYVTTLFGRRRPIPEIKSRAIQQRQLGERLAVNTIIQGSAADLMKLAMIRVHGRLRDAGLAARLVLTIHDELLIEAPEAEAAQARDLAREEMEGVYPLDPPLQVDAGIGDSWLSAG